jgi:hypothetical protein
MPQCAASPVKGNRAPIVIGALSAAADILSSDIELQARTLQAVNAHAVFAATLPIGLLVIRRTRPRMADILLGWVA